MISNIVKFSFITVKIESGVLKSEGTGVHDVQGDPLTADHCSIPNPIKK